MNEWVFENPKLIVTAFVGIVLFLIQKFVFNIPDEIRGYVDLLLANIFLFLIGRFTRITKSEAELLNEINKEDSRDQL